jgi:PEP-CTERM motif
MNSVWRTFFTSLIGSTLLLQLAPAVQAALLAYEPFDYVAGSELNTQNGGSGFAGPWGLFSGNANAIIQSGDLAVPALPSLSASSNGNSVLFSGSAATVQYKRSFANIPGTDGTTTWYSFIGQRVGPVATSGANLYPRGVNIGLFNTENTTRPERVGMGNSSGAATNDWAIIPTGSGTLYRATTNPAVTYGGGDAVWAVMRIDHHGANPDVSDGALAAADKDDVYLFINPNPAVEPSIASANATILQGDASAFDYSNLDFIRPFVGGMTSTQPYGELLVDEIRIGTDYASMTAVPEPASIALLLLSGLALVGLRRRS